MMMGDGAVAWQSKLQKAPAQSSCEAEYVAAGVASCEISWIRQFLQEIGKPIKGPTLLESDSQSAMNIASNPVNHDRTKHVELKWHLTRQMVQDKLIKVQYIRTDLQVADALTKSVPGPKLQFCARSMGVGPSPIEPSLQEGVDSMVP
jgi:hypothetical protein